MLLFCFALFSHCSAVWCYSVCCYTYVVMYVLLLAMLCQHYYPWYNAWWCSVCFYWMWLGCLLPTIKIEIIYYMLMFSCCIVNIFSSRRHRNWSLSWSGGCSAGWSASTLSAMRATKVLSTCRTVSNTDSYLASSQEILMYAYVRIVCTYICWAIWCKKTIYYHYLFALQCNIYSYSFAYPSICFIYIAMYTINEYINK